MPQDKGEACKLIMDQDKEISRRDFLKLTAIGACVTAWAMTLAGLFKFPMPALLPDISNKFKIGAPEDFPVGTTKVFPDKNVIVFRDEIGLFAISQVCTHLGCIVAQTAQGFSCPCHGSRYDEQGQVVHGPAPRALDWFEISQLPSGKLVVDAAKRVPVGTKFTV